MNTGAFPANSWCGCSGVLASAFLGVFTVAAGAHSDPQGDVHPDVRVEQGNFAIYFTNNSAHFTKEFTPDAPPSPRYRMIYSATGELLAPRHLAPGKPQVRPETSLTLASEGLVRKLGTTTFVFPHWKRLHRGKPFFLSAAEGAEPVRTELQWGGAGIHEVVDALVEEKRLGLLVTTGNENALTLWIYEFERDGGAEPRKVRLGEPATIYDFPRCSQLLRHEHALLVSWVERSREGYHMILTRWNVETGAMKREIASREADWNTDISMAAIGHRLLIAYHHGPYGRFGRITPSRILTVFRKLD